VVDAAKGTITLPLYLGHMKNGMNVWYILSDVDDAEVAALLGLNFSAKMAFMANAARTANLDQNGDLVFDKGTVDFSPVRSITPGPPGQEFPPSVAQPGSIGDKDYSPFVQIVNAGGVIYNAPIVAFGVNASDISFPNGNVDYSKVHDQVIAIDPAKMTVTINLINGFSFGKPVWYMSMDTSIPLGAAIVASAAREAFLPTTIGKRGYNQCYSCDGLEATSTLANTSKHPRTAHQAEAAHTAFAWFTISECPSRLIRAGHSGHIIRTKPSHCSKRSRNRRGRL
jgi:hypothetical protein